MEISLREKWTEALTSGNYEQGMGFLCQTDGRKCVMGVLLDVIDPNGWHTLSEEQIEEVIIAQNLSDSLWKNYLGKVPMWGSTHALLSAPDDILEKVRLTKNQQNKLQHYNDNLYLNFDELAKVIDAFENPS